MGSFDSELTTGGQIQQAKTPQLTAEYQSRGRQAMLLAIEGPYKNTSAIGTMLIAATTRQTQMNDAAQQ